MQLKLTGCLLYKKKMQHCSNNNPMISSRKHICIYFSCFFHLPLFFCISLCASSLTHLTAHHMTAQWYLTDVQGNVTVVYAECISPCAQSKNILYCIYFLCLIHLLLVKSQQKVEVCLLSTEVDVLLEWMLIKWLHSGQVSLQCFSRVLWPSYRGLLFNRFWMKIR